MPKYYVFEGTTGTAQMVTKEAAKQGGSQALEMIWGSARAS